MQKATSHLQSDFTGRRPPALLIVRPPEQAHVDLAVCRMAGWQGLICSVMRIEPLPDRQAVLQAVFSTASALFWVSPSAVRIAQTFLTPQARQQPVHIAVGRATAQSLQQAACQKIYYPQQGQDSEAVAALAVWQTLPLGAHIGLICGQGGRKLLAQTLQQRGFHIIETPIYRRVPHIPDWHTLQRADNLQAVWITSCQMVEWLFAQVPPSMVQKLQSLVYFTHHSRIEAALRASGVRQIKIVNTLKAAILNPD